MDVNLKKLEYDKILEILSKYCVTYIGKELARNLRPSNSKEEVQEMLDETFEAVNLSYRNSMPGFYEIDNIDIEIKNLESNNTLSCNSLINLKNIFKLAKELKEYFSKDFLDIKEYQKLGKLFEALYTNKEIVDTISTSIIDENTIDDKTSSNLNSIRRNKRKLEQDIRNTLNNFIHSAKYSKYIQENIITIRNDRFVIPVKAENRSEIKGFVHDISNAGATVFIEPISIFEMNNDLSKLKVDEEIEIEKILQKITALFYPYVEELKQDIELIGKLDFIFAKAKYSKEIKGITPTINKNKTVSLINARHPLIDKEKVIPISIELGKDFSTLVITGPNTGGKTVTLKTFGLLCAMACSGLNIPCSEKSSIYVFDKIFADIGDDQSIAESLSTFSSHMTNIAYILNNMTKNSLVLVDELGSGTDPLEGANLAISLLEKFHEIGAFTLATTHYHEIKDFCYVTDGYYNCSLEFDLKTLRPTYNLLMGIPGKSNAFEISRKLGIPQDVILNAKSLMDKPAIDSEQLFKEIYDDRVEIAKEKIQIEKNLNQVTLLRKKLEDENNNKLKIEEEKIENAKIQARQILIDAKDEADKMIRELNKISLSDNNKRQLENLRTKMNEKINKTEGSKLDFSNLSLLNNKYNATQEKTSRKGNISLNNTKAMTTSTEINIIGETVADGIEALDKYLDNCKMANLKIVRVVHGKGTGKLRQGVHDYLKKSKYVKSFRIASIGEGDYGVTIVELK